jgi:cyclase
VDDRLTLQRGNRTIDILHLGGGHTRADLVVHLPSEGIVISGDLIVWPVPLVGSTSYPADFAASLEKLIALQPRIIIPGHGPIMRDDAYAKQLVRLLSSIRDQTATAVAKGLTLEETRKTVNLDEFRTLFAGDSPMRRFIFHNYVTLPGIAAAYAQSKR